MNSDPWIFTNSRHFNYRFTIFTQGSFAIHFIVHSVTINNLRHYLRSFKLLNHDFIWEDYAGIVEFKIFINYIIELFHCEAMSIFILPLRKIWAWLRLCCWGWRMLNNWKICCCRIHCLWLLNLWFLFRFEHILIICNKLLYNFFFSLFY